MISTENGRVFLDRNGKRYAVWLQCPDCGPTPPVTKTVSHAVSGEPVTLLVFGAMKGHVCSNCGSDGVCREALVPDRKTEGKCGSRCWNGKISCACVCEGKCHGEGKCHCVEVVA